MADRSLFDSNGVNSLIAASSADGITPVTVYADPTTHGLVVAATISAAGLATTAKQDTGNTSLASIDTKTPALGQALAASSVPIVLTAAQITTLTPPAAITGFATAAKQPALGTAGAASADVITVQGTASGTAQPVSIATAPVLVAGSAVIGKVGIDQTTPGTTNLVALAANQSVNVAQMNGVTVLMGNGVTGTGSQRVTVASDNTPFAVKIDQTTPGTTNLVALAANQSVNTAQMNGVAVTMGNGVSGTGVQRVSLASDSTGNIATIGTSVVPGTAATNLGKAEDAAHTSGDTGVFALGVRNDTLATAVTSASGDYSQISTDTSGRVMTAAAPRLLKTSQQTTITSSTAETTVLTAVASTFLDVYGVIVTNTSATVTKVTFKDSTAGTARFVLEVPATETRGFMLPLDAAHNQATVNTNWTATCGTSVASVEITLLAVKMV